MMPSRKRNIPARLREETWYLVKYEEDENLRVLHQDDVRHIFDQEDDEVELGDIVSALWLPNGEYYDAKILQKGADKNELMKERMKLEKTTKSGRKATDVQYIEDTWVNSTVWPPKRWSIFGRSVRTNNDVEGWHHHLNRNARRGNLPLYLLVNLLHQESCLVSLQVRLVSEKKLKRQQRRKYKNLQAQIFKHWEDFIAGEMSSRQLLHACAYLNGPC